MIMLSMEMWTCCGEETGIDAETVIKRIIAEVTGMEKRAGTR